MDEEITQLREDEIEALLKFDGMTLHVHKRDDLFGSNYYAIIRGHIEVLKDDRGFMGESPSRSAAVHKAWAKYNEFRKDSPDDQHTMKWIYEDAEVNVIRRLIFNQTGKEVP